MTDTPVPPDPRDATPDWDALARYLAGESGADEARAVAAWLAEHPDDARLLTRLDAHLDATLGRAADAPLRSAPAADAPPIDVEGALARVRARRDGEGHQAPAAPDVRLLRPTRAPGRGSREPLGGGRPRGWLGWGVGGLAAAAALAAVSVELGRRDRSADAPAGTGSAAAERVVATAVGRRDSVRLPDGTRVVLAPGSRLTIAGGYGGGRREVRLEGAAWFAVRHDAARPFAVRAGGAVIRDVGTEFTVRTDGVDGPSGVAVAVTEGVVALSAGEGARGAEVTLRAGDRGEVRADGVVASTRGAVTADDVAWTRGRLVYRAAPLDVVRADLRRWYGIELRVADAALAGRRLTATFEGEPATRVVEVVALALGATVTQAGDTAVLRAAAPPRTPGGVER